MQHVQSNEIKSQIPLLTAIPLLAKVGVSGREVKFSRPINWYQPNVGPELTTRGVTFHKAFFLYALTRMLEPETLAGRLGSSCWLQGSPQPLKFRWKKGVTQQHR